MKKLILITLLICLNSFAQQPQYALNLDPEYSGIIKGGMAIKDNYLYYGIAFNNNTYKIKKIDLSASPNQTPVVIANAVGNVWALCFYGNELYIAESGAIKKIDLSASNPVLNTVLENLSFTSSLAVYNNYLYFCERYNRRISRINLLEPNPTLEILFSSTNPFVWLQVLNNDMYVSELVDISAKVSKFNLLEANPLLTGVIDNIVNVGIISFYINDTNFFFEESTGFFSGALYRINYNSSNQTPILYTDYQWPGLDGYDGIIVHNNYMYVNKSNGIRKFYFNPSFLNIDEKIYEDKISFYPNPAQNNITFNQEVKTVSVYTLDGKLLNTQLINNQIDLFGFNPGIYLVRGTANDGVSFSEKLVKN